MTDAAMHKPVLLHLTALMALHGASSLVDLVDKQQDRIARLADEIAVLRSVAEETGASPFLKDFQFVGTGGASSATVRQTSEGELFSPAVRRVAAYRTIDGERDYQDRKWGQGTAPRGRRVAGHHAEAPR